MPSAEMAKLRVAARVAHGGHNIPQPDIERRFPRSLRHLFDDFSHRVDGRTCFMNHGESPVLVNPVVIYPVARCELPQGKSDVQRGVLEHGQQSRIGQRTMKLGNAWNGAGGFGAFVQCQRGPVGMH